MHLTYKHKPALGSFPWVWQLRDAAGQLLAGGYEATEADAILSATTTRDAIREQDAAPLSTSSHE